MISLFTSLVASGEGWSDPNKVTRTTLSRVWDPRDMTRVAIRETPSGAISVATLKRGGAALLPTMT